MEANNPSEAPRTGPTASYLRRTLPHAVALVLLGAAGTGAHVYFTHQTGQLRRSLEYLEAENTSLQRGLERAYRQLRESDEALHRRIQEHETELVKTITGIAERADTLGSALAVMSTEHQRLRHAHSTIDAEAQRYHAQAAASIAQLVDDANALVFEPAKHYAILTPTGVKAYPIISHFEDKIRQLRNPSSKAMQCRLYDINDDLFSSSVSLTDILMYLSHSAEKPATARGRLIVHPQSAYARIPELMRQERDGAHAFISRLLEAAQRDHPLTPAGSLNFSEQLKAALNNKVYALFLTEAASDPVLSYLSFLEDPLEFTGTTHQVSLAYESLALLGAETFCPTHKDAAMTAFTAVFDVITAKQRLGVGHYGAFRGSTFAERAASLATFSRRELSDVASETLATHRQK